MVSFVILSFNQERFVGDAIRSALSQTYQNIEIIFSDDCSVDGTHGRVKEIIEGSKVPGVVRCRFNQKNQGLIAHLNAVLEEARGDIIILSAADDISEPNRVSATVDYFNNNPQKLLAGCWFTDMTVDGTLRGINKFDDCCQVNSDLKSGFAEVVGGATIALKKSVIDTFGPIVFDKAAEDIVFTYRAALFNAVGIIPLPLVRYRRHADQMSNVVSSGLHVYFHTKLRLHQGNYFSACQLLLDVKKFETLNIFSEGLIVDLNWIKRREELHILFFQKRFVQWFFARYKVDGLVSAVFALSQEVRHIIWIFRNSLIKKFLKR